MIQNLARRAASSDVVILDVDKEDRLNLPTEVWHKADVRTYWDRQTCGTDAARSAKYTRAYFEEIEEHRYEKEPEIFSFAQFTRYHGQKVLEVGVGAGTDFTQWVRAGAHAYGVDLSEEAVAHARSRLDVYGLEAAEVRIADAENLPYSDDEFDLTYSWGVVHHTPDTTGALREIVRVTRRGGTCKIMVYNRHSVVALALWIRFALLSGRPLRSLNSVLNHHMESPGTKGFTRREIERLLQSLPVTDVRVRAPLTSSDLSPRGSSKTRFLTALARLFAVALGWREPGWFLQIEMKKAQPQGG